MNSLGDFDTSAVIYGKFATYRPSTGATFTLAGSPALSVYKDNSTTQSTTGVTLTADFDSVTGLNHFAIDTSADGTFYSAGSFFDIVITTGTVDSVSVTGSCVGQFTLRKTADLKPTTAGRTLDVSSTGEGGVDWANVGSPSTSVNLSATTVGTAAALTAVSSGAITEASYATTAGSFAPLGVIDQGTAQSATGTTVVLRSAAAFGDNTLVGSTIMVQGSTQGYWQSGLISANVGSTDTVTVPTWAVTPSGTITYKVFGTAAATGATDPWSTALPGSYASGTAGKILGTNLDTTVSSRLAPTTASRTLDVSATGEAGVDWANVGSPTTSVNLSATTISTSQGIASVSGAVGSVTGNVGGNVTGTVAGVTPATNAGVLTTALTESYAADGAAGTLSQLLFGIQAFLQERAVSGTTVTVKKLDGSTSAMTFTLNDGTTPTSITRAT